MRTALSLQSYRHRSLPVSAQRLVNLFTEAQPDGAKSKAALLPTPGLRLRTELDTGPVRALFSMGDALVVVYGPHVASISRGGTIQYFGRIAPGWARVEWATDGYQAVICTPASGEVWLIKEGAMSRLVLDFQVVSLDYVGGFFVYAELNSSTFWVSDVGDAATVNGLAFANADRTPDNIVAVRNVGGDLWIFGSTSLEVWSNQGLVPEPFVPITGAFAMRGCANAATIATHQAGVFWLGDDRVTYRNNGYQPVAVSTAAINQAVAGYSRIDDAAAWIHEAEGHVFYVQTFPTGGVTWVYDLTTQLWHERASRDYPGWRCICGAAFAGQALGGDAVTGQIWIIDPTAGTEDGTEISRLATGSVTYNEGKRLFFASIEADMETGSAPATGQGSDPRVWLRWSDDAGRTWSDERWASLGRQGAYATRARWSRLGAARNRVFQIGYSDPVPTSLSAVNIEVEPGDA